MSKRAGYITYNGQEWSVIQLIVVGETGNRYGRIMAVTQNLNKASGPVFVAQLYVDGQGPWMPLIDKEINRE